jgi:hypothetical protein
MRQRVNCSIALLCGVSIADPTTASVNWYINKAIWQANAGAHSTITFTELPANTFITDQYAHLGVHFTDGSDTIYNNTNIFLDGYGLNGAFDETTLEFDSPMTAIAVDFPGSVAFNLYSKGRLIYESPVFDDAFSPFAGLVSTVPFDKALLYDPFGGLRADTLYFGPPIPAPAGLGILALAGMCVRRRTRG